MDSYKDKKVQILFLVLASIFLTNALLAEFIGVKIFSLEKSLGITPFNFSLFGTDGLSFNLTAGVLIWPVVFVFTDIINEYFGKKGVKKITYISIVMIAYSFLIVFLAIELVPADFWTTSHIPEGDPQNIASKVSDYNHAFKLIFGQGLWIIIGSLVAFLIGQLLDVIIFQKIKYYTGDKFLWLRATGSTLVSQFIDSFVVLFIAFYLGADWSLKLVLTIGIVNYLYKCFIALILTPLLYIIHYIIDTYLGEEMAIRLKNNALSR